MFSIRLAIQQVLKLTIVLALSFPAIGSASTVRMQTVLGDIDIQLFDSAAPLTVANFMNYVNGGAYNNSFIHRNIPGFVIQGGSFTYSNSLGPVTIPTGPSVLNEFDPSRSNLRGTIAMAKLGGDPNSATSGWFFNLADNASNLDSQNGGFTVFGQVIGNGMQIVDAISALYTVNAGGAFANLPLASLPANGYIHSENLVMVNNVSAITPAPTPAALWLLGSGLLGLAGFAKRKRISQ